jgi:membrane-associated phospholipid phosphatase
MTKKPAATETRSRQAALPIVLTLVVIGLSAAAPPLVGQDPVVPHGIRFWLGAGALGAGAMALDRPLHSFAATHRAPFLDRMAADVDPIGRAEYLVPALAAAVVFPAAIGEWRFARGALRVGAGYISADLAGGALRVAVARHRPDSTGDPWRFRPLRPQGEWGSMPSAHVTHAFAIASGIAEETGQPLAAGIGYGVASLLAAQRVYRQSHWASDVVVGAALSTAVSRRIVGLLSR